MSKLQRCIERVDEDDQGDVLCNDPALYVWDNDVLCGDCMHERLSEMVPGESVLLRVLNEDEVAATRAEQELMR